MLPREPHPLDAVIADVVVRHTDDVDPRPCELFGERGLGAQPSAAALVHRVRLVIVEQHLEIRERHIGAPNQVDHAKELGLLVRRERTRDDRVADECHGERLGRRCDALRVACSGDADGENNTETE